MAKIDTRCVHAGYTPGKGEPRQLPIIQSTTFKYETSDQMGRLFDLEDSGYFYTRLQNPTVDATAAQINDLEGGVGAILTASGQAANLFAVINIAGAGDHIIAANNIYGGTFNLLGVSLPKLGIDITFLKADTTDAEIEAAIRPNTKLVFGETISNPGVEVFDIERWAKVAHRNGLPLIVDNTFATPVLCRPFEWGADIVTHSTTKYIDGHGVSVGGALVDSGNFPGNSTQSDSPASPPPTNPTTASPTPRSSGRPPTSPRQSPTSCVTSGPSKVPRMPSTCTWASRRCTCASDAIAKAHAR